MAIVLTRSGAEGQNRTADTMIFSHVLYRLSYLGTSDQTDLLGTIKPHNIPLVWHVVNVQVFLSGVPA